MLKNKLPHTAEFLSQINYLLQRESLAECWEVLWRKWNTAILTEHFADNHLLAVEGKINKISIDLYSEAKQEIISALKKLESKQKEQIGLSDLIKKELKHSYILLSYEGLLAHLKKLNNEKPEFKIPLVIKGMYDSDREEDWIVTNKRIHLDADEIPFFKSLIQPIVLALENLLMIVEIQTKLGSKEIKDLFVKESGVTSDIHYLPSLMKNPALFEEINEYLLAHGFIERRDGNKKRPYLWVEKDDNEAMEIYSSIDDNSADYNGRKKKKFSIMLQVAAFSYWLSQNKQFKKDKYVPHNVANYFIQYYNLNDSPASIKKAFGSKKRFEVYLDYYRDLKNKLKL